jgi:pSer/pThr/pTyr-binding forkhead associated (FHA) protein
MLISCLQCGGALADDAAFCQRCGAPVGLPPLDDSALVCSGCGNHNPVGTNFCHACGRRLGHTTPMSADASAALAAAVAARPSVVAASQPGGPRLVAVRRDGSDGESYLLPGEQVDIGRSEGDLHFDDPHLAPRHARISLRAGQHLITPLEFLSDIEKTLRPAVEHGVVLFGTPVKAPWGRLRQLTSAGTSRDVFHLIRSDLVLGREQGDIVFSDDEFMSRRHALLQFRDGRALLTDLGSSNGTFVRLTGQHALATGEMIRLGDELLRFEMG